MFLASPSHSRLTAGDADRAEALLLASSCSSAAIEMRRGLGHFERALELAEHLEPHAVGGLALLRGQALEAEGQVRAGALGRGWGGGCWAVWRECRLTMTRLFESEASGSREGAPCCIALISWLACEAALALQWLPLPSPARPAMPNAHPCPCPQVEAALATYQQALSAPDLTLSSGLEGAAERHAQCMAGLARCSILAGDVERGVELAAAAGAPELLLQCAELLETQEQPKQVGGFWLDGWGWSRAACASCGVRWVVLSRSIHLQMRAAGGNRLRHQTLLLAPLLTPGRPAVRPRWSAQARGAPIPVLPRVWTAGWSVGACRQPRAVAAVRPGQGG